MNELTYRLSLTHYIWQVWYVPELDELVLFKIDQDDVCQVFRKGGTDAIGFLEFMNLNKAEFIGDL